MFVPSVASSLVLGVELGLTQPADVLPPIAVNLPHVHFVPVPRGVRERALSAHVRVKRAPTSLVVAKIGSRRKKKLYYFVSPEVEGFKGPKRAQMKGIIM